MSKKLSGAENRKRKAEKNQAFQEHIKSMNLEKYIKIDKNINLPSTSSDIKYQDTEILQNSQVSNTSRKKESETEFSKGAELNTQNFSNDCQTFNDPDTPSSLLNSASMDCKVSSEKEESEIDREEIATTVDNSLIDDANLALQKIKHIDLSDPKTWPKKLNMREVDYLVMQGPVQATSEKYPCDNRGRHFLEIYYSRKLANNESIIRRWLMYSKSSDKIFCFCCFIFKPDFRVPFSNDGYCDWIHASSAISSHENSASHRSCYIDWIEAEKRLKTNMTIDCLEQSLIVREAEHWKNVLLRLMNIILYMTKNNMAFRGSSDKLFTPNNGKYLGLIELLAKFDPVMKEHVHRILRGEIKDHYCGKNIAQEFIGLMAKEVNNEIISRIQKAKYFSIIADCTPDISHTEQLSLTIRYVHLLEDEVEICESFIGFDPILDSTGAGLTTAILNMLQVNGLELKNCRGQGYDNGSNMKGKNIGVQKRILTLNPLAFFLTCGCHNLCLILCDAAQTSVMSISLFGILGRLYSLFAGSVKRWKILLDHLKTFTLKRLSDTRWEAKISSVKAVRYQIADVHDALITLAEYEEKMDKKIAHEALTLAAQLKDFKFLVSLVVWYEILFQINIVSKSMQNQKIDVHDVQRLVNDCLKFLKNYKEKGFENSIITAKELAAELQTEPVFKDDKRIRRIKRQFDYESVDNPLKDPQKKFEIEFFNSLLDVVLTSFEERFSLFDDHSKIWGFLYDIKNLDIGRDELLEKCKTLQSNLTDDSTVDIDGISLCDELMSIQFFLKSEKDSSPLAVLNFIKKRKLEDLYPNVYVSLRILLTLPVVVASGERSFSKLKLIKYYLRATMGENQLNHLAKLSIENKLADEIDFDKIIKIFADAKARKVKFLT